MTDIEPWVPPERGAQGWDTPLNEKLAELVAGVNASAQSSDLDPYITTVDANTALAAKQATSEKGVAGGYAPLDPDGDAVNAAGEKLLSAASLLGLKGEPGGLAELDGGGLLVESQVPERLTSAALNSTYPRGLSGQFMSVLRRGQADAVLNVLGDSTGNETTEWVYLTAQWLASQFPAYTVLYRLWNDGAQNYDAAVTIQTGTGARTLTIYNGSVSGAGYNYPFGSSVPTTRFFKILPLQPTAVIVNYGYNSATPTYRRQTLELGNWILRNYPGVELIVTSQAPVASTNPDSADNLLRRADIRLIAAEKGWGLIDVTQPFLDFGDYDTLINPDLIHPNTAGTQLWVDQVTAYFGDEAPRQQARIAPAISERFLMDATRFISYSGTPALGFTSGIIMPHWSFDAASAEFIIGMTDIPPEWKTANVHLLWTTPGGSTNSVVWQLDHFNVSDSMMVQSQKPAGGATAGTPVTVASVTTAGVVRKTTVYMGERFSGGRPVAFRIRRDAGNGADTYTSDAQVYGLLIERAE